jgi:Patatin-like phospholipase
MPPNSQPLSLNDVVDEELKLLRPQGEGTADVPLTALCISGGGIRSATFGLGAIQGLAEQGVLKEFDYLSTVSGGGYIGGWLTSWKQRVGGLEKILPKLRPCAPHPKPDELDPVGYLRDYNNYLSPKLGFLSADTWTLAATVMTNMALNWLVFVPLLLFALMLPRLVLSLGLLSALNPEAVSPGLDLPLRIASALFFAIAIFNALRYLPGVGGINHTETDFLKYCLAPLLLAALAFMTHDAWFDPVNPNEQVPYWQMVVWITAACAAGWLAYVVFCVSGFSKKSKLLLGPLTFAIALTGVSTASGAWLLVNKVFLTGTWASYTSLGPSLLLLSFMLAGGLFVGLTSRALGDEDREWLSRGSAWVLLFVVCWSGLCGIVLIVPTWIFLLGGWLQSTIAAAGGLAGGISAMAGFRSRSTPSQETAQPPRSNKTLAMEVAAKLAAPIFVAALLVGLAILTNWLLATLALEAQDWTKHESFIELTPAYIVAAGAVVFLLIGWIAARFININKFSLHAMYRNRLIRAFLGASNDRSKVNKFIGFTESDNIKMWKLDPTLKPFHVVNITLNLVAGKRLAWQQRKAESFTVSPLHSGSYRLGYRPSNEYGGPGGISLGTAITISGAAASPNMGYHSAGVIGFIMTLFNARLGAWLGNPSPAGNRTWRLDGPSSAVASLVREAFGLTNDTSSYVYLSDGGHFENLGLYEMIMRRCKRIVVLDSGCDPNFIYEDMGNALRKIRIDMGITIDVGDGFIKPDSKTRRRCAFATIKYSEVDATQGDGVLLYIKPMMTGNEPPDVSTYYASHCDFPHQSTADQWYDESQTESYRMLGLHTIQDLCAGWAEKDRVAGLNGMFQHVHDSYLGQRALGASGD